MPSTILPRGLSSATLLYVRCFRLILWTANVGSKILMGPRGKYNVQTTLDSEAICERKSAGCSVSLTDERAEGGGGGGQERIFQVLDIFD